MFAGIEDGHGGGGDRKRRGEYSSLARHSVCDKQCSSKDCRTRAQWMGREFALRARNRYSVVGTCWNYAPE
jgi:hypothetical protein